MLNTKQIESVIDQTVKLMRKDLPSGIPMYGQPEKPKEEYPEYHNSYRHSCEMADIISIHAVPGRKPDKLVAERAPNQTEKEFDYALKNYQQTTLPVFLDAVHTMQRAFSDNNWSIDWKEDSQAKEYFSIGIASAPLKMSYETYMFQVVPSYKMIDAQGCIAYKPAFIPTVETDDGQVLIDSQVSFSPYPIYYPSNKLLYYNEGKEYFFLTEEKSLVDNGDKRVLEGIVFELYDEKYIYKIIQVGKIQDWTFEIIQWYTHDLGYTPVDRLKGIPGYLNQEIIYQSLFLFATPNLNDALLDGIMLRSIKAASVFPFRVMVGDMCTHSEMIGDQIRKCDGNGYIVTDYVTGRRKTCPTCMGSGTKGRITPHGVLILRPETISNPQGELRATQPAMYYVEPTVETPGFLRSEIEKNIDRARNVLHLRTSESTVKGSDNLTATGMVLDEKALYSTVKMFSDQVFDLYESGLKTMGKMRLGLKWEPPVVTRSITFDFATEYEYMERISLAIKNGLPPFVVYEIVYRYIKTMFYNEMERAEVFDLMITTDLLLVTPYEQINMDVARGVTAPWQVVLHNSGVNLIKLLIEKDSKFLDQDRSVQREQLENEAKRVADENKTAQPTSPASVVEKVIQESEIAA